jgi:hypothetical protein
VQVLDVSMAVILVGLGAFYVLVDRIRISASAEATLRDAPERQIARSVVNQ